MYLQLSNPQLTAANLQLQYRYPLILLANALIAIIYHTVVFLKFQLYRDKSSMVVTVLILLV